MPGSEWNHSNYIRYHVELTLETYVKTNMFDIWVKN